MRQGYAGSTDVRWKQARRTAFVQDVLATFTKQSDSLLSFEQVSQRLKLKNVHYLHLQEVPLDHIVGSVGRYSDFTRAFFPRGDHLQERWQRVEQLVASGRDMPPVELYLVGQVYFVRDGNHRVSVSRQLGRPSIWAHVWEYETPVPLQPDSDVDELLSRAAHAAFLEQTHIDRTRPELHLRLTQPDGYQDLLTEIGSFQRILSELDGRELTIDEAAALWYDIRYMPIVQIMRERQVLREFPQRTEADLYLWLCRNRQDLETRYERQVLMGEAAEDLAGHRGVAHFSVQRLRRSLSRAARTAAGWASSGRRAVGRVRRRKTSG